jgi:hypothetical protein
MYRYLLQDYAALPKEDVEDILYTINGWITHPQLFPIDIRGIIYNKYGDKLRALLQETERLDDGA